MLRQKIGSRLLLGLCLVAVFLLTWNTIADFDTGYHLTNGQYIIENLRVPLRDIFSYTAPGAPWVNHYWLADAIFYLVSLSFGLRGLMFFVASMAALAYFFVIKTAQLRATSPTLAFFILVPYSYLTFEMWVVRPQIFSYLFAALLVFILEKWRLGQNVKILYLAPLTMLAWANTHAGVVLGLVILAFYAGALILRNNFDFRGIKKPLLFFGFSAVIVLLNPNGYGIITYSSLIAPAVKELKIVEWGSLLQFLAPIQAKIFLLEMILAAVAVGAWLFGKMREWRSLPLELATIFFLAILMPIASIRHVGFFPLLTFPLFIIAANDFLNKEKIARARKIIVPAAYLCLILFAGSSLLYDLRKPIIDGDTLPVGAADFIEKNGIAGPMFNLPSDGGYLIWKLWPKEKVFMDGRSEIYAGGVDKDFIAIMQQDAGWEKLVNEKYKFNYFILSWSYEPLYNGTRNLAIRLNDQLGFRLVFWDDVSIVMLKNTAANRALMEKYSYSIVNPYRDPAQISPQYMPQAMSEIQRAIAASPNSTVLRDYTKLLLKAAYQNK